MDIEIPGYKILSELGQGAMGTVFLAVQESLQRKVALKVLHVWLTNDLSFRERFMKEGRIVARLKHNNIVTVHDIGHHENRYYMDLEYAGGGSLSDRIAQGMSDKEAIRIIVEIARALSYAHKHDFIHRDIKPENILFREDGTPLISDFGIAKTMTGNTQLTVAGSAIGTPDYMSPEQAMGGEVSAQSDIYSLGVTFFEALTGGRPYRADSAYAVVAKHVNEPIPTLPPQFRYLQPVMDKCLAKRPADRYATADDLVVGLLGAGGGVSGTDHTVLLSPGQMRAGEAVSTVTGQTPGGRPSEAAMTAMPPPADRKGLWLAVAAALVLAVGGALVWQWPVLTGGDELPAGDVATTVELTLPEAGYDQQFMLLEGLAGRYARAAELAEATGVSASDVDWAGLAVKMRVLVDAAYASGQSALGRSLAERALAAVPASVALQDWRQQVSALIDPATLTPQQREQVDRLLAEADAHLAAGRFTLPENANALSALRAVLRLDRYNEVARRRLASMAEHFAVLAREGLAADDVQSAGRHIEIGLMIAPHHDGLQALSRKFKAD